jgi:hypothetical protein
MSLSKHSLLKSKYLLPSIFMMVFMTSAVSLGYKGYIHRVQSFLGIAPAVVSTSSNAPVQGAPSPTPLPTPAKTLPPEVIYSNLFLHVDKINKEAEALSKQGKDPKQLLGIFKRGAALTDQQEQALFKAATAFKKSYADLDKKYAAMLTLTKENIRKAKESKAKAVFPDEFKKYQDEQKALLTSSMKKLRTDLGATAAQRLEKFILHYTSEAKAQTKNKSVVFNTIPMPSPSPAVQASTTP